MSPGHWPRSAGPPRHKVGILTGGLATDSPSQLQRSANSSFMRRSQTGSLSRNSPGDQYVDKHDPINNCVISKARSYQNEPANTVPTQVIGFAGDGSASQVTIVTDILKKTVYAVKRGTADVCGPSTSPCSNWPGSPQEVRPGDQVTFRIEYAIPSGDAENVVIDDWLPLPIFDVGDPDADPNTSPPWTLATPCPSNAIPAPGHAGCGPNHTAPVNLPVVTVFPVPTLAPSQAVNGIQFTYGPAIYDIYNTNKRIDLLFTIVVTHEPFADGLYLTNEATECENNTFGVRFCQTAIARVNVREPEALHQEGRHRYEQSVRGANYNDVPAPLTAGLPIGTPPGVLPTAPPRFTPPINSGQSRRFHRPRPEQRGWRAIGSPLPLPSRTRRRAGV